MTDNRKRVLEMLDARKITVDEAMRLLEAMEGGGQSSSEAKTTATGNIKFLRILVDSPHGHRGSEGPTKVNIRVPLSLIRAGIKFKSLIPDEAGARVEEALKQKGFKFNVKNLKDEDFEQLVQAMASGMEIDIDENGGHGKVMIFAEQDTNAG